MHPDEPESTPPENPVVRHARRVVVAVGGVSLLLVGVVLLFIPGPGTAAILAGFALLATEFVWARRWLRIVKERAGEAVDQARRGRSDPK
ncbi:MAG: PGPGW domain-containing protein [Alphaproteobacteria bacterium]|nr:PGPGW domain-containing protein [Alphaproteobacteria bacterium]